MPAAREANRPLSPPAAVVPSAQPDADDLGVAVAAQHPYGAAGVAAAAGRHSGGQVLVLAVGGQDGAAVLSGGDAGAAYGLAGPRARMIVGRDGLVADEGQREGAYAEVDEAVVGAAAAGWIHGGAHERAGGAGAFVAHGVAAAGVAVTGGQGVGAPVAAGVGVGDGAHIRRGDAVAGADADAGGAGGRACGESCGGQGGADDGGGGALAAVMVSVPVGLGVRTCSSWWVLLPGQPALSVRGRTDSAVSLRRRRSARC